jgi:electron transfer flavoprotein alpha subunit
MAKGILIYVEHRDGKVKKVTLEMLSKGKFLADKLKEDMAALILGNQIKDIAESLKGYVDKVYVVDDERLKDYSTGGYSNVIADIIKDKDPSIFLMGATAIGKDLAPRVSAKLDTGLVSDCVDMDVNEEGKLVIRRPVYAGKAYVNVYSNSYPQMATVRPNVLPVLEPFTDDSLSIENISISSYPEVKEKILDIIKKGGERPVLTEANIIVSGGRGMKSAENFVIIEELAEVLGAAVGASRAAVDSGFRPQEDQVGQTGKVVSPSLYIACGISGAIQHLAGMRTSKYIVAINKDPDAPIFKIADYGIVGDLFKVVPVLTDEFKKLKAQD